MVQKFQKDLALGWLIRNSLRLLVLSFSALCNIDWILQGRIKLQTAARLLNSVAGKNPNMLTHLKSVLLSENLAQQFTCCASSKEILHQFDCNVAHRAVLLSAQQGCVFRDHFLIFRTAAEIHGSECDERTLVGFPLFDTKCTECLCLRALHGT